LRANDSLGLASLRAISIALLNTGAWKNIKLFISQFTLAIFGYFMSNSAFLYCYLFSYIIFVLIKVTSIKKE